MRVQDGKLDIFVIPTTLKIKLKPTIFFSITEIKTNTRLNLQNELYKQILRIIKEPLVCRSGSETIVQECLQTPDDLHLVQLQPQEWAKPEASLKPHF
jgi:hypothetical protein